MKRLLCSSLVTGFLAETSYNSFPGGNLQGEARGKVIFLETGCRLIVVSI